MSVEQETSDYFKRLAVSLGILANGVVALAGGFILDSAYEKNLAFYYFSTNDRFSDLIVTLVQAGLTLSAIGTLSMMATVIKAKYFALMYHGPDILALPDIPKPSSRLGPISSLLYKLASPF